MKSEEILQRAIDHMRSRAAARDQPEGERSMSRTVAAFNALTGHKLSERDGWMFMVALKAARACTTPAGIADDYEDGAAYFGLAGEAAAGECAPPAPCVEASEEKRRIFEIPGLGIVFVSDDAKWIAQDQNGEWYTYRSEPGCADSTWYSDCKNAIYVGDGDPHTDDGWRFTLRELPA